MKRWRPVLPSRTQIQDARARIQDDLRVLRARLGQWSGRIVLAVRREYRGLRLAEMLRRVLGEVLANPRLGRAAFGLAVLAWSAMILWARILVPLAARPYFMPQPRFQSVAFFENGAGPEFPDSLPTFRSYVRLFDVVSPFWYSVGPSGDVAGGGYRPEVVDFARRKGLKVVPLVNNAKAGPDNSFEAIRTDAARARTVDALAAVAESRGYDGLNLDFELLPPEARDSYTALVTSLAAVLHAQGRTLTVSVFPDVEVSPELSGFFDYAAIGRAADFVVLMAYDRHWPATGPGPISPEPWVEAGLDSLLKYVPARKVILGIGSHAYDWPASAGTGIAEYLSTRTALQRAAAAGSATVYDSASRQSSFSYIAGEGSVRQVWVQDAPSLADKAALAQKRGLGGTALWRLGFSEDGALERFGRALGRRP